MLTSGPSAKVVQLALGDDAETSVPLKPDHASVDTGGVTTANVSSAHRRYATEVTCIIGELATLLSAGVSLTDALSTLARQHRGRMRQTLLQCVDRVAEGRRFSDALAQHPDMFDAVMLHSVRVGEDSGRLEETLNVLANHRERWQGVTSQITSALLYPAVVLVLSVAVSIFLMTFVVPAILEEIDRPMSELPWVTRAVSWTSTQMLTHGWWLAPAAVGMGGAIVWLVTAGPLRRPWHALQLRLPILGALVRKQTVVHQATVVAVLMRSGVPFERALDVACRATGNLVMRDAMRHCAESVRNGLDIAPSLERTGQFLPSVVQIFAVGQVSGRLEEMLERLATDYERQVLILARRLTLCLEPVLILFLGVIVGVIALATLLPILEASHAL